MKVYIVYEEYQSDTPGFVGVFANKERAEAEAERVREALRADGSNVWGDHVGDDEECDWDVDVHVVEMEVVS